jgi:hypothetical protein
MFGIVEKEITTVDFSSLDIDGDVLGKMLAILPNLNKLILSNI